MLENAMVLYDEPDDSMDEEYLADDDMILDWAYSNSTVFHAFLMELCSWDRKNAAQAKFFISEIWATDIIDMLPEHFVADLVRKYIKDSVRQDDFLEFARNLHSEY